MKVVYSVYVLTILGCLGFILANREPGLGVVGIVVIAGAVAGVTTLGLGGVLLSRWWRRREQR